MNSSEIGLSESCLCGTCLVFRVVDGGQEFTIGLRFLMPRLWKEFTGIMLLNCLIIHDCLAAFRTMSLFRYSDIDPFTISLFKGECLLLAA